MGRSAAGSPARAVREGAQDYLVEGQLDPAGLTRAVRCAVERQRVQNTLRGMSLVDQVIADPAGTGRSVVRCGFSFGC